MTVIGWSPKGTKSIAVGNAHGRLTEFIPTLKGLQSNALCDPFRVGTFYSSLPVALPPATELGPYGARHHF
jgi:hypothetical protein